MNYDTLLVVYNILFLKSSPIGKLSDKIPQISKNISIVHDQSYTILVGINTEWSLKLILRGETTYKKVVKRVTRSYFYSVFAFCILIQMCTNPSFPRTIIQYTRMSKIKNQLQLKTYIIFHKKC